MKSVNGSLKIYLNFLGLSLLIACFWGSLFAQNDENVFKYQQMLKDRLTSIIKAFDPQAHLFVKLKSKKVSGKLPMTPFSLNQLDLSTKGEMPQIESIEINILSSKKRFPTRIRELVRNIAVEFGKEPVINFKPLPKELISPDKATLDKLKRDLDQKDRELNAKKSGEYQVLKDLLGTLTKKADISWPNWLQWAEKYLPEKHSIPVNQVLIVIFLTGTVLLLGFMWALRNWMVIRKISRSMDSNISNLVNAIEQASGGGMGPAQIGDVDAPGEAARGLSPVSGEESVIKSLPYNSIAALLTDCYWSQQDQYAAYIWMQISISMKEKLMDDIPFLMTYVSYLTTVEGVNLGHDQDPYYLNPLDISHIDNEILTNLTQGNPILMKKLPPMRVNYLNLKISQKIELLHKVTDVSVTELPDFKQIEESEPRMIKKKEMFRIQSIEEEMEVLQASYKKEDVMDVVSSVASLGWITMLPSERATDILHNYNARQIASAWIGPDEVLDKIGSYMNRDKLDLVISYAERMTPSREGRVFRMLDEAAVSYMKQDMDSCSISFKSSDGVDEQPQEGIQIEGEIAEEEAQAGQADQVEEGEFAEEEAQADQVEEGEFAEEEAQTDQVEEGEFAEEEAQTDHVEEGEIVEESFEIQEEGDLLEKQEDSDEQKKDAA